ncbi:MAG: hypothetical protein Q7S28_00045 [bacterium]|nr:hypothetical protein [bacterium]
MSTLKFEKIKIKWAIAWFFIILAISPFFGIEGAWFFLLPFTVSLQMYPTHFFADILKVSYATEQIIKTLLLIGGLVLEFLLIYIFVALYINWIQKQQKPATSFSPTTPKIMWSLVFGFVMRILAPAMLLTASTPLFFPFILIIYPVALVNLIPFVHNSLIVNFILESVYIYFVLSLISLLKSKRKIENDIDKTPLLS